MANDSLKNLRKKLNKKEPDFKGRFERDDLPVTKEKVRTYWQQTSEQKRDLKQAMESMRKHKKFPVSKFLSLVFVLLAIGTAVYFWFGESNVISSKKINITVEGSSLVKSGELNKWYIVVENNNDVGLELADLIIEYPSGFLSSDGEELSKERRSMGAISSHGEAREELNLLLLGEENSQREMKITLEYRMEDSNAIFAKTVQHTVEMSRSPVGISVKLPEETESGQEITIQVEYVSNSDIILEDIYFKVEYPSGFQFTGATPNPESNGLWLAGDLAPQEKKVLEIKGFLEGQDLTDLGFRALVGSMDEKGIFRPFSSSAESVLLKRSFMNLSFLVNGSDVEVISGNKNLNITIPWKNNLPTEIHNVAISVKMLSEVVDLKTLSINNGFYKSSDESIVWDSTGVADLLSISPGQSGSVAFSIGLKDSYPIQKINDKNFTIELFGEMFGYKLGDNGQQTLIKSNTEKQIRIESKAQLVSRLSYFAGNLPPKVGQTTVYTVVWSISNFYNDISDVAVKSSLPSHASWVGPVSPNEEITYNASSRELRWNINKIESGTGILRSAKEISFQISLSPSLNQVGQDLVMVQQTSLEGRDIFTDTVITDSEGTLSTKSINEARSNYLMGQVIE